MAVPSSPDHADAAWLTSRLRAIGVAGAVTDVATQPVGAGQVGDSTRFLLTASGDMPRSLVGKFPAADPTSRFFAEQVSSYEREVFFYSTLAQTVDVQTPRCFVAEFDPGTGNFALLLEDLAPGIQIDQMSECDIDQAALALEELAKLHGPRWGDRRLAEMPLLGPIEPKSVPMPSFDLLLNAFSERYGGRLSAAEFAGAEEFARRQDAYNVLDSPRTVIHGDYRLDNMMFGGPHPLTVLDWQSVNLGHAFQDACYFMGTSLSAERRAQEERRLLKHYLDVLASYGVVLDADAAWRMYRHFAPAGLYIAVMVSTVVARTERGDAMFMAMAKRSLAMCRDLETFALLREQG